MEYLSFNLWRRESLERFKKVFVASVLLSGLLIGSIVIWFVASNQPPLLQRVPLFYWEFEDYSSIFVVNRSQGAFHDNHVVIASVNRTSENYPQGVFLGLRLKGFHYTPSSEAGASSVILPESLVASRLDLLVALGNEKKLRIEELSLSCEFDESMGEDVLTSLHDPVQTFTYNLQLIQGTKGYALPFEPIATWKCMDNFHKASVIDDLPITFFSYNNSTNHEFVLTLTLIYSANFSFKQQISTSLHIVIED
jgi:hypothetical protein